MAILYKTDDILMLILQVISPSWQRIKTGNGPSTALSAMMSSVRPSRPRPFCCTSTPVGWRDWIPGRITALVVKWPLTSLTRASTSTHSRSSWPPLLQGQPQVFFLRLSRPTGCGLLYPSETPTGEMLDLQAAQFCDGVG